MKTTFNPKAELANTKSEKKLNPNGTSLTNFEKEEEEKEPLSNGG